MSKRQHGAPGAPVPIAPEHLEKWCDMAEAEARESRRLGLAMVLALHALASFCGPDGCFPAIAAVAALAQVSENTVREAIARAVAIGMLRLIDRGRRHEMRGGRLVPLRQSYGYEFILPPVAVPARAEGKAWRSAWWQRHRARRLARDPDSRVRRVKNEKKILLSALAASLPEISKQEARQQERAPGGAGGPAPMTLAEVRAASEARALAAWQARRRPPPGR